MPSPHKTSKRVRKPQAFFFQDGDGMFTLRCNYREQAIKAMQTLLREDPEMVMEFEGFDPANFNPEKVEEERMYQHRACNYYSIGDNLCGECGEPCSEKGRKTFVYYF